MMAIFASLAPVAIQQGKYIAGYKRRITRKARQVFSKKQGQQGDNGDTKRFLQYGSLRFTGIGHAIWMPCISL
jgi:NADH dehydrogenase FAD-containing subunit